MNKQSILEGFKKVKGKDFSRKDEDFTFIDTNKRLKEIESYLRDASKAVDLESNDISEVEDAILNAMKAFNENAKAILNFRNVSKPQDAQNSIINRVKELYRNIFQNNGQYSIIPVIANRERLNSLDPENINELLKRARKKEERTDRLEKEAEELAEKEITKTYAKKFLSESKRYSMKGSSGIYFVMGVLLILALSFILLRTTFLELDENTKNAVGAIISTEDVSSWNTLPFMLPYLIKKFIIISFFIFGIRFCFKNFSISQHQFTLNKQKAVALESLKLLHETLSPDSPQRDEFLIEVSKIIYSPIETGYLKRESKDSQLMIPTSFQKIFRDNK